MKKICLIISVLVLILSCSDYHTLMNRTSENVNVCYSNSYFYVEKNSFIEIPSSIFHDFKNGYVIKSENEKNIKDNAYIVSEDTITYSIKNDYIIKNNIPSAQYTGDKIYLTDANGKMGRYTPSDENRIELTEGLVTSTTIYGTPDFILVNDAGDKVTTFGGYPVNIRVENGVVYIE